MKIPGYRVHRKIGKGGMATVFLATQESFGRKVALKIIADSAFGNELLSDRFSDEARIVASFSHPHIVSVYEVGKIEQFHYLSMDYLQGGDLSRWIKSGLEQEEAESIIIQIAHALHYAHGKGYIHRDIKPDNILFREDNSAVLTDFGIAQPVSTAGSSGVSRMVVGTPSYMSPEQTQGKPTDARSDIYALGIMFYQMLTRELPYRADSYKALVLKHIKEPIPKLPFKLSRYQPLIDTMLAKKPEDRFQSCLAFIKALQQLADGIDMISVQHAIADLSLVDVDVTTSRSTTTTPNKDFTVDEIVFRKLGLLKRYQFVGTLCSSDNQHFSVLFGQLTTRLLEWYFEREKRAAAIQFNFYIDATMADFVNKKINALKNDRENFGFLADTNLQLSLSDLQGKAL